MATHKPVSIYIYPMYFCSVLTPEICVTDFCTIYLNVFTYINWLIREFSVMMLMVWSSSTTNFRSRVCSTIEIAILQEENIFFQGFYYFQFKLIFP